MKELDAVGGQSFLAGLLDGVLTSGNAEEHAKLIADCAARRALIVATAEAAQLAYDDRVPAAEAISEATAGLVGVMTKTMHQESREVRIRDVMARHKQVLEVRARAKDGVTGVPTGFTKVDRETCGMQGGELWMIGADSGVGKTIVAEQMNVAAAEAGYPSLFFSMEMDQIQIADRLTARMSRIEHWQVRSGRIPRSVIDEHELVCKRVYNLPYWIDDTPGLSIAQIEARARLAKMQRGIKLVTLDYLLLINMARELERGNEEMAIRRSLIALHRLARTLDIPVVVVQQLSRDKELRKRAPTIRDLKGSQACESEPNVVLLIWRPEMETVVKEKRQFDKAQFILAKQRSGRVCMLRMMFDCDHVRFETPTGWDDGPSAAITDEGELLDDIPE
jgi:replicative DNA helicase